MKKHHWRMAAALLCLCLLLHGCGRTNRQGCDLTVFAMDTAITLRLSGPHADAAAEAAQKELLRLEALLDAEGASLTALRETGELTDAELAGLISRAKSIGEATGGALDISLYPVIRAWGFIDRQYRVPSADELAALRPFVDGSAIEVAGNRVTLPAGSSLTLGAIAKGYAGDRLAAVCREAGVESGVLSLGGNVRLIGDKDGEPWKVGIRAPEGGNALTLALSDLSVVTSGGYERYFEADGQLYHHILSPETLAPAQSDLTSVTVVSSDGTLADALSTALFVMGRDAAMAYYDAHGTDDGFELVLLTADHDLYLSPGLADKLISHSEAYTLRDFR